MATVKTQDGKVLLKNGKVSCTCCTTACCMYPREFFGEGLPGDGTFSVDDLPEKLNVNFPEGAGEWTLNKVGNVYLPPGPIDPNGLAYGYAELGSWVLWYLDELGETYTNRPISPCLITGDGNLTPGDDTVEDQFNACYKVTHLIFGSHETTRESLCVWLYTQDIGPPPNTITLSYSDVSNKWNVVLDTTGTGGYYGSGEKTSPDQSSPIGDYYDWINDLNFTVEAC